MYLVELEDGRLVARTGEELAAAGQGNTPAAAR